MKSYEIVGVIMISAGFTFIFTGDTFIKWMGALSLLVGVFLCLPPRVR